MVICNQSMDTEDQMPNVSKTTCVCIRDNTSWTWRISWDPSSGRLDGDESGQNVSATLVVSTHQLPHETLYVNGTRIFLTKSITKMCLSTFHNNFIHFDAFTTMTIRTSQIYVQFDMFHQDTNRINKAHTAVPPNSMTEQLAHIIANVHTSNVHPISANQDYLTPALGRHTSVSCWTSTCSCWTSTCSCWTSTCSCWTTTCSCCSHQRRSRGYNY